MPYMSFGDMGQEETSEQVLFDYSGELVSDGLGKPPKHHHHGHHGRGRGSYWGPGYWGGYPYFTVAYDDLSSEKLDKIYDRHKDEMTKAGFPPGTWIRLTAKQKLDAFAKVIGKQKGVSDYYRPAAEMIPGMLSHHAGSMRVNPWVHGPMPDPNELNAMLGDLGKNHAFTPAHQDALQRFAPAIQRILAEDLLDPEAAPGVLELLEQRDPVDVLSKMVADASVGGGVSGLSDLGKFSLKKTVKKVTATVKKVVAKVPAVVKKVAPFTSLPALIASKTKFGKNVIQKVREAAKKYGPTALKVAGVVAAPFTGGASLALTSAVGVWEQVKVAKANAKLAKDQARADAAALEAEAQRQEAELNGQLDVFYAQNQQAMTAFGFPPETWAKMSAKEKIEAVDKANQGVSGVAELDKFYGENQEAMTLLGYGVSVWATMSVEAKTAAIDKAVAMTADQWNVLVQAQGGGATMYAGGSKEGAALETQGSIPPSEVPVDASAPPPPPPPTVSGGAFKLVVEGNEVGSYGSVEEAASAALSMTKPGDRFDVIANGQPTGLRIRTGTGATEVPADMVAQVKAMSPAQVQEAVAKTEVKQAGGGFPLWLLAIPAVAIAASVK